jgi:uncharacterized protein (DUF2267 family)
VLVATDCLSEGINLQEHFNAVVHYDLPWNPNRLEQREGRVDRFGQNAPQVKAILLYGRDNPIDGAVLDVLLRKARQIHRTLRISVPVPTHSETVLEAVLQALFLRGQAEAGQRSLFAADEEALLRQVHLDWDRAADRERISRSRFAQRSIQPDEVQRELEETDQVLGDPQAVERFVRAACERLGAPLSPAPKAGPQRPTWYLPLTGLPAPLRERLPTPPRTRGRGAGEEVLRVIFDTPAPEGTVYIGRHHPFTGALAEYLLDAAFAPPEEETSRSRPPLAARGGVLRTDAVERRTTLLLLRLRYLLAEAGGENPLLAEEALVWGFRGRPGDLQWLPDEETMDLLAAARPTANVTPEERREVLEAALAALPDLEADLTARMEARAQALEQSHRRVRRSLPPLAKGRPGG